jgi:UDP-N-acetylglucosamine acyltransferase
MIHKTAIVDPKAKISTNVNIGAYTIIGPNVEIGEETEINSHVSIAGHTKIGKKNKIYPFASIGNNPQDLKYKGEKSTLEIGNGNTIREYVSINPGTEGGGGLTKIGNNCLFMVSSHVAHDCAIGDNVVAVNNVAIGGHVQIDDNAIIGGNSAIHQYIRIGKFAMIGGICAVIRDVIPYGLVHGNRSVLQGINLIGLRRKNIPNQEIILLSKAYKEIFKSENLSENLKNLSEEFKENDLVKEILKFIQKDKKRPICTPFLK